MHGHWLKNILGGGSGGGDSGGGGSAEPFVVRLSGTPKTADKTFQEIADAFDAGEMIRVVGLTDGDGNSRFAFITQCTAEPAASTCAFVCWNPASEAFDQVVSNNGDGGPDEEDPSDYPYFVSSDDGPPV